MVLFAPPLPLLPSPADYSHPHPKKPSCQPTPIVPSTTLKRQYHHFDEIFVLGRNKRSANPLAKISLKGDISFSVNDIDIEHNNAGVNKMTGYLQTTSIIAFSSKESFAI